MAKEKVTICVWIGSWKPCFQYGRERFLQIAAVQCFRWKRPFVSPPYNNVAALQVLLGWTKSVTSWIQVLTMRLT